MARLLRKIVSGASYVRMPEREFQWQLDTQTVAAVCHAGNGDGSHVDIDDRLRQVASWDHKKRLSFVKEELVKQSVELCKASLVQSSENVGFSVREGMSDIPRTTSGVFSCDSVRPGRVMALYPGAVFTNRCLSAKKTAEQAKEHLKTSEYVHMRPDRVVIDAGVRLPPLEEEDLTPDSAEQTTGRQDNPWAIAHKINHPVNRRVPNVIAFPVNFPSTMDALLQRTVPNVYFFHVAPSRKPKGQLIPSVAFVSLQAISKDEELLVDFRLNPAHKSSWPSWYEAFDEEAASRRWNTASLWANPGGISGLND